MLLLKFFKIGNFFTIVLRISVGRTVNCCALSLIVSNTFSIIRNIVKKTQSITFTIWISRATNLTVATTTKRGKSYVHQIKAAISHSVAHSCTFDTTKLPLPVCIAPYYLPLYFFVEKRVSKHMPVKNTVCAPLIFRYCVRFSCTWDLKGKNNWGECFFVG